MKKLLADFDGVVLSRDQMKAVKGGGINCTCDYGGFATIESCGGPDVETCNGYDCPGGGVNSGCQNTV